MHNEKAIKVIREQNRNMAEKSGNGSENESSHKEEAIRYRALVESMNDGFGIVNNEGIFTYVNPRFAKMLEYLPEEMIGKALTDFLDDANKKILRENIRQRTKGQATQYEMEWIKSSGEGVFTIVSGAPLMNGDGKHKGSFAVITDISELKESREALEESAEMMRRIFEDSQVGLELFDSEGILIAANQAALDIGGVSRIEELLGFSLFDDPNVPSEIKAKLIRGEPVRYQVTFDFDKVREKKLYDTKRSGTMVVDAWVTPLGLEKGGALKGYLGQITEKTEHLATEAALQDSEKRYQLLAENVTDVIFTTDLELNLTYVSTSVGLLLGYTAEELLGKSMIELMTADSVWAAIGTMAEALEHEKKSDQIQHHGESPPIELKLKHMNGSIIWTEVARTFLRDENGKPIGVLGVARNIEERKEAEEALKASELKYRTLIDQSFQGSVIIQPLPLAVKFTNPAFAGFLGLEVNEVLALSPRNIQNIIHPDDWDKLTNRLQDLMAGEPPRSNPLIMRVFHKDGSLQHLEVFGRRVEFEGDPALQVVAMNFTERINADKHIRTQKERAMLYLDLMSHDFRNQLQVILGSTMVLEEKLRDPNDRRLLGQIVSAVERCQSMISKVKVTEPLMSVPLHPRRLDPTIEEIVELQRKQHEGVEIDLAIKSKGAIVEADEFLEQLLTNLIENAVEHNPNPEKKVWVTLFKSGDGFEISVSDNGHGLSEALKIAIFDVTRRYGGVGLLQSKQICDKYGGRIAVRDRVQGQPGEGAEFSIWLPKAKNSENGS
ncbi:MAG: PAS domain S-box protein [Candidatus Thorarchaeota archaeon]|nr:PAS domain S-box protein [Candidatus Thorarchaeota archaeon]